MGWNAEQARRTPARRGRKAGIDLTRPAPDTDSLCSRNVASQPGRLRAGIGCCHGSIDRPREWVGRGQELVALRAGVEALRRGMGAVVRTTPWPAVIRLDPTLSDGTGMHGKEKVYGSIP